MPTTIDGRKILADSNILIRLVNSDDPQHHLVASAIDELQENGFEVLYTPQNLREFWNVATRPVSANGFGFSIPVADVSARRIESLFIILRDSEAIHLAWREMVVTQEVRGVKVHDARLAAAAIVSGCRAILTFNDTDFKRFGVSTLHPADVEAFLASA